METPLSRFKRADVCFWQFSADERKFLGLRMRFARGNVRDHLDSAKLDHSLRSRAMERYSGGEVQKSTSVKFFISGQACDVAHWHFSDLARCPS